MTALVHPLLRCFVPGVWRTRARRLTCGASALREQGSMKRLARPHKRLLGAAAALLAMPLARLSVATFGGPFEAMQGAGIDTPPALHLEAAAFDRHEGRLLVFGGSAWRGTQPDTAAVYRGRTWTWGTQGWRVIGDSSAGPTPRAAHAMAYDPVGRRIMLFGGAAGPPGRDAELCDTWMFAQQRWQRLSGGPCFTTRTALPSLVFDSTERRMLLVEGFTPPATRDTVIRASRLWQWARDEWVLADSTGPRMARTTRAVFDERRSVLVVPIFAGPDVGVWEWDGQSWRRTTAVAPAPRVGYALAYDADLGGVIMVGGRSMSSPPRDLNDAWSWDGSEWREIVSKESQVPSGRMLATLVSDPENKRLLMFGGTNMVAPVADMWELGARGWRPIETRSSR